MSSNIYQWGKKFISKSKKIHHDKYDYSKVNYINAKTHITIVCPVHGDFKQTPDRHLNRKQGCPKCGGVSRLSTSEFVEKARLVHGNTYEYMLVNYEATHKKIQIVCHKHGVFKQTAKDHLSGSGCPKCGGCAPMTRTDFVIRSTKTHDNKYDYSAVEYINDRTRVVIKCPIHGEFMQVPYAHIRGQGCPKCNRPGGYSEKVFEDNKELKTRCGRLYLIRFTNLTENLQFLKIGITQSSIDNRFKNGYSDYGYEVLVDKELELYEAFQLEQHIISAFSATKFKPKKPFVGRTECFTTQYTNQITKTILEA